MKSPKLSPNKYYDRGSLARALTTHQTGGFYHDGRFATLLDVINHYNNFRGLNSTDWEKRDLVEYLKPIWN